MIGYIYRLICSETGNLYFGSTTSPDKRYRKHKSKFNKCSSRVLINPTMEIIETVNGTRDELELIEKNYILNNTCVNIKVPKRSYKEWYEDKKKKNPLYLKMVYQQNGGTLRNLRTRRKCDCGGVYVQRNQKIHFSTNKHKKYITNL